MEGVLEFLRLAEKLKCVERTNYLSVGGRESAAAHSWGLGLFIMVFAGRVKNKVDVERCLKMAVVHDLPEAEVGDVGLHETIDNVGADARKCERELVVLERMRGMLAEGAGEEIYELWREYEDGETAEAKFVKALDKLEATWQALMYGDVRYWANYGEGDEYFDIVLNDRKKKWYGYEEVFVEFAEVMKGMLREQMRAAGLSPEEIEGRG